MARTRIKSTAIDTTTGAGLPVGTTAQRPASPTNGTIRINTTTNFLEVYYAGGWNNISAVGQYTVEYLIVAGGGAGGVNSAGGGGAGGLISGNATVSNLTNYTVTVGAGAPAAVSPTLGSQAVGTKGSDSSFTLVATTVLGGAGGSNSSVVGGSGGGSTTSTHTAGQGYAGGGANGSNPGGGGGAGGTGAAFSGSWPSSGTSGAGGVGAITTIISTATATSQGVGQVSGGNLYFSGGGGGSGDYRGAAAGTGGLGGGGAGSSVVGANATSGTVNTGGGGGGSSYGTPQGNSGAGGSGIVIIRYLGIQRGTGGTVVTDGSYTVHIFKTSGTFIA